jgi:hypothetical protein
MWLGLYLLLGFLRGGCAVLYLRIRCWGGIGMGGLEQGKMDR